MIPNPPKYYETHQNMSLGSNGVDQVCSLRKLQCDFVVRTYVLHQFSMFCNKFHAVTKWSQMHPNTMKQTETLVWGPMGWIGCVRCRKSRRHFVARTFALIAPVHPVLHRVSCSYEKIPNAPEHYEMHQNMSLGSNGGGLVAFVEKNSGVTSWHELSH